MSAGPERAIAATKTYTTELLAIAALGAALGRRPADTARAGLDPRGARDDARAGAGHRRDAPRRTPAPTGALVLARGYEYATAREWALKIKELAHVFADPYSAADFQHGPLALVEPGVPVLAVVRPGPAAAGLIDAARAAPRRPRCRARRASDVEDALALARWPSRCRRARRMARADRRSIVVGPAPRAPPDARARASTPTLRGRISKVTLTR